MPALTIAQLYRARCDRWNCSSDGSNNIRIKAFCCTFPERGEDPSLGGDLRLRLGGHRQKATETRSQSLQNSPSSQRDDLRENPDFRGFLSFDEQLPGTIDISS